MSGDSEESTSSEKDGLIRSSRCTKCHLMHTMEITCPLAEMLHVVENENTGFSENADRRVFCRSCN